MGAVICGLLMLAAPFLISSPSMLSEVKWELMDSGSEEDGEELDLGLSASAEARAEAGRMR